MRRGGKGDGVVVVEVLVGVVVVVVIVEVVEGATGGEDPSFGRTVRMNKGIVF